MWQCMRPPRDAGVAAGAVPQSVGEGGVWVGSLARYLTALVVCRCQGGKWHHRTLLVTVDGLVLSIR